MDLFKLVGRLTLDGVETAQKQLNSFEKRVNKALKPLDKFGKQVTAAGVGLTKMTAPITALAVGIGALTVETGQYADKLLDLEQITGLSTDTLQEMEHVSRVAGVSFEGLTETITKFQARLPQVIDESGRSHDALLSLGYSASEVLEKSKDMDSFFPELIKRLQGIEDITERNATAQQIFGRSMRDLAPVLGMTADQFKKARDEAHEMGIVLDKDALNSANDMRVEIERVKATFVGFTRSLTVEFLPIVKESVVPLVKDSLIPALQGIADRVRSVIKWFGDLPKGVQENTIKFAALAVAIGPVLIVAGKLITSIKTVTTVITTARLALIAFNATILANPFSAFVLAVGAAGLAVKGLIDKHKELREQHRKWKIETAEQSQIDAFTKGVDNLRKKFVEYGEQLKDPTKAQELLGDDIETLTKQARELGYTVEGDLSVKLARLDRISHSLTGTVFELGKGVITADKEMKDLGENTKKTGEELKKIADLPEMELNFAARDIDTSKSKEELEEYNRKRFEYEQQYSSLVFQESASRLDIIEKEQMVALGIAEHLGADKTNIEKYYSDQKKQIIAEEATASKNTLLGAISSWASEFGNIISSVSGLFSQLFTNRNAEIDNWLEKQLEANEQSTLSEEEKAAKKEELEEQADQKRRVLQLKQAKADKATSIFGAIVNTAQAVTKALTAGPFSGPAMAAIHGALGAVQIGLIAAQPLPQLDTGGILNDDMVIQAHKKEAILPLTDAVMGDLGDRIAKASHTSEVAPKQTKIINQHTHLHIGNYYGDEQSKVDLVRDLKPIWQRELKRSGEV